MPDEIIFENLQLIAESIKLISSRFSRIKHPDNFVSDESGVIILDAIAMRLQVIGELLKKIDKKDRHPSFASLHFLEQAPYFLGIIPQKV